MDRLTLYLLLAFLAIAALALLIVLAIKSSEGGGSNDKPVIVGFDVNTTNVAPNQSVVFTYSAENATKLTITDQNGDSIGDLPTATSGTVYSPPLIKSSTYTFTLSAYGSDLQKPAVTSSAPSITVQADLPPPPQIENIYVYGGDKPLPPSGLDGIFDITDNNNPYASITTEDQTLFIYINCDLSNEPNGYFVLNYIDLKGVPQTLLNYTSVSATVYYFTLNLGGAADRVITISANGQGGQTSAQVAVYINPVNNEPKLTASISSTPGAATTTCLTSKSVPVNGTYYFNWDAPGARYVQFESLSPPQTSQPDNFVGASRFLLPSGSGMLFPSYMMQPILYQMQNPDATAAATVSLYSNYSICVD